jgi:hypothetical protein
MMNYIDIIIIADEQNSIVKVNIYQSTDKSETSRRPGNWKQVSSHR